MADAHAPAFSLFLFIQYQVKSLFLVELKFPIIRYQRQVLFDGMSYYHMVRRILMYEDTGIYQNSH